MTGSGPSTTILTFTLAGLAAVGAARDPTQPTPTPTAAARGERSLSAYAARTPLDGGDARQRDGRTVITNDTLERLRGDGLLTTAAQTPLPVAMPPLTPTPRAARRSYWKRRVDAQRDNIERVRRELALADTRIEALEDAAFAGGRGSAKLWAKVAEAKERRRVTLQHLQREEATLAAIIRAARQEGAEPGWFR